MSKSLFLISKLSSFLLFIHFFLLPAFCEERILSYQVDILVNQDSSLNIREQIEVVAEGDKIRHGIYRDFPTRYVTKSGRGVRVGFEVIAVKLDGSPEKFHSERRGNGIRTYLGDKDVYVSTGNHTYTLDYVTTHQLGFFEDHDELYFNAIGHGWEFPIDRATVRVQLPGTFNLDELKAEAFTGVSGSTEKNFTSRFFGNIYEFRTNRTLQPSEGFTIVLGWPKGYVKVPSKTDQMIYESHDLMLALLGLLIFIGAVSAQFFIWKTVGKDPKKGVLYPRYEIPENIPPYALPYIQSMSYKPKCLASAIITIATKGFISIKESDGFLGFGVKPILLKSEIKRSPLTSLEERIFSTLLSKDEELVCDNKNHQIFGKAQKALTKALDSKYKKYFRLNYPMGILTFAIGFILSLFIMNIFDRIDMTLIGIALAAVLGVITFVFIKIVKTYTKEGRTVLDEIEGYKLFLETAEKGHYDQVKYPDITEERFEEHFPFAVALGVEALWMSAFRKSLEKAGKSFDDYHPVYYQGHNSFSHSKSFSDSSSFSSYISSAATAPGSSSGFSGGSSGGGGGGGGGGGW